MMIARGAALVWAVWFGLSLAGRREIDNVRPVAHAHCIYKLAAVAPMMMLCIAAYVRPILEAGSFAGVWVVAAESASIAIAWHLLIKLPISLQL